MRRKLLLLAITVLAGGLAIFVLSRPPIKKQNQNSPNQTSNSSTGPSQQQDNSDQFLIIKEWGVKFRLPKELRGDIAYGVSVVKQPEEGDDPNEIYIESKSLTALSRACGLIQNNDEYSSGLYGGRYSVTRSKVNADEFGNQSGVTDGTYWYFATPSHASCDQNTGLQSEIDKKDGELREQIVKGGVFKQVYKN